MPSLEARVEALEAVLLECRLENLSDDELEAHIVTLPRGTPKRLEAVIALILRHPSVFPVVESDPAHDEGWLDSDTEP